MKGECAVRRRTLLLVLYGSALLFRLLYLWDAGDNPFLEALGLDARYYDRRAGEILTGGLIGGDAYFMGPLYPHLLAALYGLAGRSLLLVRIVQAFLGAFVPVLLYRIGRRVAPPAPALVASLLAVVYGPLLFYTGTILYTTLAVTLVLWILDRLMSRRHSGTFAGTVPTGILFGLASVGKGNLVLFLPFALLHLARGAGRGRWSRRAPLGLLAGFLLVTGVVAARNYAASGDRVILTSNGGLNFYIGNGPESSGAYEKPKGLDVDRDPAGRALLEKQLGRPLSPSELSGEWRRRALAWIAENPEAEARLLLRKAVFFFSTFEIPQIESYRFQMRYSPLVEIFHIPFGIVAPLGLAATAFLRGANGALLLSFLYSYAASIVLFFVLTRYRLPVAPVLLLLASITVAALVRAATRRDTRELLRRIAWIVPFFVLCNINFYHLSPRSGEAQSHFRLGIIHQSRGDTEEALRHYRISVDLDPAYARSRLNLGELLAVSGRRSEAEAEFREAIRIDPEYTKAHFNLGTLLYRTGRPGEGRRELERAVDLDRAYGKAWLHLAVLDLLEGSSAAGEKAERALASLPPGDPSRIVATEAAARIGEADAIGRWREAHGLSRTLPETVREALAAELLRDRADVGDLYRRSAAEAGVTGRHALGLYLFRKGEGAAAGALLDAVRREAPDMPYVGFALGVLRHGEGRAREALDLFLAETRANDSFAPAWKNAALLASRAGRPEEARTLAAGYLRRGGEEDGAIRSILSLPDSSRGEGRSGMR